MFFKILRTLKNISGFKKYKNGKVVKKDRNIAIPPNRVITRFPWILRVSNLSIASTLIASFLMRGVIIKEIIKDIENKNRYFIISY